jgi:hypothetical protein
VSQAENTQNSINFDSCGRGHEEASVIVGLAGTTEKKKVGHVPRVEDGTEEDLNFCASIIKGYHGPALNNGHIVARWLRECYHIRKNGGSCGENRFRNTKNPVFRFDH